jgi:hypothetical protein
MKHSFLVNGQYVGQEPILFYGIGLCEGLALGNS